MDSVELLKKLVSFNSIFPNESELAHYLADELKHSGFKVEMQKFDDNRYNVLASRGSVGKPVLLYGHIDTVPAYGYDSVDRDPFKLEESNGKLYGLGAYDMKAGIAAMLKAVKETKNDRAIKIMFVSDEEVDSRGCYFATKTDFLKDVVFAISGDVSDIFDINQKTNNIMLGRRGRAQYEINVPGNSSHGAKIEQGISAVTEAAKLTIEVENMNSELPTHPKLTKGNLFVRRFFSESLSLSVPDQAMLIVDRHLVVPENTESARSGIEKRINQLYNKKILQEVNSKRATIREKPREVPYLMPYVVPEDNYYVKKLSTAVENVLGVRANYNYGLSVADENLVAMQNIPVVCYGPIGQGEHSNGEWVSKKSYLELIEVLKDFISSP